MAETTTTGQAPPAAAAPPAKATPQAQLPGEIIFEIADVGIPHPTDPERWIRSPRNRNVQYPPSKTILRGRWSRTSMTPHEAASEGLDAVPTEIPGMMILIDARKRRIRIFDPLSQPENKTFATKLFDMIKRLWGDRVGPIETVEQVELKPSQIKTSLWWCYRLVKDGSARVVSGTMPTEKEIKALPGKIRIEIYNQSSSPKVIRFIEDQPREDWDEAQESLLASN